MTKGLLEILKKSSKKAVARVHVKTCPTNARRRKQESLSPSFRNLARTGVTITVHNVLALTIHSRALPLPREDLWDALGHPTVKVLKNSARKTYFSSDLSNVLKM